MLTHSADLCSLLSDTVPLLQGEEAGSPIDSKPEVFWPWTSVSVCGVWLSQVMHPYCVFVKHNLSFFWLFVSGGNVTFFFFPRHDFLDSTKYYPWKLHEYIYTWMDAKTSDQQAFSVRFACPPAEKLFLWKFILDFLPTVISSVALQWQTLSCFLLQSSTHVHTYDFLTVSLCEIRGIDCF